MFRVCLVGNGGIATEHARALAAIEEVELIWVISPQKEAVEAFEHKFRFQRAGTDLNQALKDGTLNLVVITSPSAFHAPQTLQALHSGKDVVVEIPIALELSDAEEVRRCSEATGRRVFVCHTTRSVRASGSP
jgi:predicted dehydrogenase